VELEWEEGEEPMVEQLLEEELEEEEEEIERGKEVVKCPNLVRASC
jgi:hypothetical protein